MTSNSIDSGATKMGDCTLYNYPELSIANYKEIQKLKQQTPTATSLYRVDICWSFMNTPRVSRDTSFNYAAGDFRLTIYSTEELTTTMTIEEMISKGVPITSWANGIYIGYSDATYPAETITGHILIYNSDIKENTFTAYYDVLNGFDSDTGLISLPLSDLNTKYMGVDTKYIYINKLQ